MAEPRRWPRAALAGALVAVAAYLCADTLWLYLHGPPPPPAARETTPPPPPAAPAEAAVRQWRLFGATAGTAPAGGAVDAPETALELTLVGVIQGGAPREGWAIVRGEDGNTHLHRVGDELAAGTTLHAVAPRHVLLARQGHLEKLTLDNQPALQGVAAGPEPPATDEDTRSRLIKGLGVAPIRPGMAAGYRVEDPEGGLARKYGFQEGDEILSVNGYPLGTPGDDRLAYHQARQAEVARLRVRRGDREIQLEYHAGEDRIEGLDALAPE